MFSYINQWSTGNLRRKKSPEQGVLAEAVSVEQQASVRVSRVSLIFPLIRTLKGKSVL
jgi:hypothetical protein